MYLHLCRCFCVLAVLSPASTHQQTCFLSPEPGFWTVEGQWLPSNEACPFLNLAGTQEPSLALPQHNAVHVLLYGDSNDNKVLEDFCREEAPHAHGAEVFRSCHHDLYSVSYQAMVGSLVERHNAATI